MPDPSPWFLHPQLAADSHSVRDLPLSRVLIIKDANYPWTILVPRRPDITEILDLGAAEQTQLMGEITRLGAALKAITACDKLNIAALGNVVPQFHVHVIARSKSDPPWPQPVWGKLKPRCYDRVTLERFAVLLDEALGLS